MKHEWDIITFLFKLFGYSLSNFRKRLNLSIKFCQGSVI